MEEKLPKTVMIDVNLILPKKLRKDLHDGEIVCPVCNGLGTRKVEQNYGISGRTMKYGFEFKHESFFPCKNCFNGIVKTCKFCGQPSRDRAKIYPEDVCTCDDARKHQDQGRTQKDWEKWNKAKKITLAEAYQQFDMFFIDSADEYVDADELEDWLADNTDEETGELRIYGTHITTLSFDASSLIEDACCDLHDETGNHISDDQVKALQALLDGWAGENVAGTKTYWPDWSVGVILPEHLKKAV